MPLIDVTGNDIYCPPDAPALLTPTQMAVIQFGSRLAGEMFTNVDELHLEQGTPADAIQVDFHRYSDHAINPVDFWIKSQLTEILGEEDERHQVRDLLIGIVMDLFRESSYLHEVPFKWALDVFMGPYAHGCISNDRGEIVHRW